MQSSSTSTYIDLPRCRVLQLAVHIGSIKIHSRLVSIIRIIIISIASQTFPSTMTKSFHLSNICLLIIYVLPQLKLMHSILSSRMCSFSLVAEKSNRNAKQSTVRKLSIKLMVSKQNLSSE